MVHLTLGLGRGGLACTESSRLTLRHGWGERGGGMGGGAPRGGLLYRLG